MNSLNIVVEGLWSLMKDFSRRMLFMQSSVYAYHISNNRCKRSGVFRVLCDLEFKSANNAQRGFFIWNAVFSTIAPSSHISSFHFLPANPDGNNYNLFIREKENHAWL
jgi:hypothetical protein